ncbi:MAG: hypothetical protein KGI82_00475 [Betaproteobacteria bacterium]|nr:hypothetical protein [Betaproteobacteria bacterium]
MSKGSTATTSTGPAPYLTSDYQNLANAGTGIYGSGYSADQALQNQGLSQLQAATASNPIGSSAQGYFNTLESGSLLNPATNPSLQGMAQLADNQIQNNLSSEFAGSGRNIEASAPVQASQMANVASDIYGGAYNNTLNNMTAGMGQASQLEGEQMMPGTTALSVPGSQLSSYGSLLGSMPGGTASTPYYTNAASGALSGAIPGALIGNALGGTSGGGWGALLGGALGAFA